MDGKNTWALIAGPLLEHIHSICSGLRPQALPSALAIPWFCGGASLCHSHPGRYECVRNAIAIAVGISLCAIGDLPRRRPAP